MVCGKDRRNCITLYDTTVELVVFLCYGRDMEETKEKLAAKYIYGDIDQDVFKTVVKIYRKECEKAKIRQLKSLKKKNKREIRRNGRTKLLR